MWLGKRIVGDRRGGDMFRAYVAGFSPDIDFKKGMDLREKTDILEAGCIMAKAQAVVGLDSGLTNLAACTQTPMVLGMTISTLQIPPRDPKLTIIVEPTEDVTCRNCAQKIRFVLGDDTRECYTKTFACTKSMTPDRYIAALEKLLPA